ncbi:MAG: response regulator, partial [Calditrichaeota bacterium]|nr:response regulator [Calditrichota bacterium]
MELNGIKALYVEDNRMTARVLESRLTKRGAQVRLADSGEAGLKAIEAEHFDLLVVDYQLPGMDGLEVIQNLASRGKLPSTIMLTATGDEGIAVEAIKWGASDYLVKEGNYLDLLPAVIRQVLEQTEVLREKQLAEERLRFSESTKSALLDAMPDAIITLDPLLRIIEYRVPENHLFPRENLVGVPVREVLPMQAGIEKLDGIWALRNSQLPVTVEFWHEGPNGERRYYENRISRFWDAYLLLVIRDVTARVKA